MPESAPPDEPMCIQIDECMAMLNAPGGINGDTLRVRGWKGGDWLPVLSRCEYADGVFVQLPAYDHPFFVSNTEIANTQPLAWSQELALPAEELQGKGPTAGPRL